MTKSFVVSILRKTSLAAFVDVLRSRSELSAEMSPETQPPKRVRVIHLGRLLGPADVVDEVVPEGGVVHVVISDPPASGAGPSGAHEAARMFHASDQVAADERLARQLAGQLNAPRAGSARLGRGSLLAPPEDPPRDEERGADGGEAGEDEEEDGEEDDE